MTPPTKCYIYMRIYSVNSERVVTYIGITNNMQIRQWNHDCGTTRTTKRFNECYGSPIEIVYTEVQSRLLAELLEKRYKKLTQIKKLKVTKNWMRWAG